MKCGRGVRRLRGRCRLCADGVPAGENLVKKFKALPDHRWELQPTRPLTELPKEGKLTVSIKDKQGNVTRIERTFSVGAATSKR